MNYLTLSTLGLCMALGGCASEPRSVEEDVNALVANIQAPADAADVVTWVQPKNHSVDCKLYVSYARSAPEVIHETTWDGNCKAGYALGIGREIIKSSQGTGSAISRYSGGEVRPDNYYQTNREPALVAFGDPLNGNLLMWIQGQPSAKPVISVGHTTRELDGTAYSSLFNPVDGSTWFVKTFPSGYELHYRYSADPQHPAAIEIFSTKAQALTGYVVRLYKTGAVEFLQAGPAVARVKRLPDSYLRFLSDTLTEIRQKDATAFHNAESSAVTTTAYKRAESTSATPEAAAKLCEESDELVRNAALLKAANREREQRFTHVLQTQKIAGYWLRALAEYDPATPRLLNSLGGAVDQYVESVNRVGVMARYIEEAAEIRPAGCPASTAS